MMRALLALGVDHPEARRLIDQTEREGGCTIRLALPDERGRVLLRRMRGNHVEEWAL